jgi:hypothetical protein
VAATVAATAGEAVVALKIELAAEAVSPPPKWDGVVSVLPEAVDVGLTNIDPFPPKTEVVAPIPPMNEPLWVVVVVLGDRVGVGRSACLVTCEVTDGVILKAGVAATAEVLVALFLVASEITGKALVSVPKLKGAGVAIAVVTAAFEVAADVELAPVVVATVFPNPENNTGACLAAAAEVP